jgi:Na+/melibiose symporter-like transporter
MAVVTSFRNFVRNLGGTLGLALSGTIINNAVSATLKPLGLSSPEIQLLINSPGIFRDEFGDERTQSIRAELSAAYVKGFRIVFIVSAVLNALAFLFAWFLMPQVELNRKDDAKLKEEGQKRHDARQEKRLKV